MDQVLVSEILVIVQMGLVVGAFVGVICLMDLFCARKSKWYLLHARYPVQNRPVGVSYRSWRASFERMGYKYGPRVIFTDQGIYFYFGPLTGLALFHRPFLLPWDKVTHLHRTGRPFEEVLEVRLKAEEIKFLVRLPEKSEPEFFKYYRQAHAEQHRGSADQVSAERPAHQCSHS